jgi:hypothetical protein
MRLGSLVCGLLVSIIYLIDFLYLQRGMESRPCCEILYIRCTHNACTVLCLLYVNPLEKSPLPLYTLQTIVLLLLLCTSSIS